MLAAFYELNGAARDVLRVGEVETPMPGEGEVRVRLKVSGVNPSDVKARAGVTRKMSYPRVIPHSDGAGVIDSVGRGVDPARVGQRVWIWNAQWMRPFGSAAEFVVLPSRQAVPLPAHIGYEAGACLGIPALTAYHAVTRNGSVEGKAVLVSGGAGAVSHYAIQVAKAGGALVITTVSSPEKAELAIRAGADVTINYRNQDVAGVVKECTNGRGVELLIELDLAANAHLFSGVLAPHGKVVVYGTGQPSASIPSYFCHFNSISIDFFLLYTLDESARVAAIDGLSRLLERDALIHNISTRLKLGEIVVAHELVESGKANGNVVIGID